jgi:dihydrofolate reductase
MIYLIAAICEGNGIGLVNKMPWRIPEDMRHFKAITKHHAVVMGRNTYFSIPESRRPLTDRLNIVLTRHPEKYQNHKDVIFTDKLDDYIHMDLYIIGGSEIYRQFIDSVDGMYLTVIKKTYECDTFFPDYRHKFSLESVSEPMLSTDEACEFVFEHHIRVTRF